jgi:hypothetical protein
VSIIQACSSKLELQKMALEEFESCLKWNIDLCFQWVPREENCIADNISKILDTDTL